VRRYVAPILAGSPRPRVRIETGQGPITLELLADAAPLTVHNFLTLARDGFFDDGVWHRVVPNFVLQDGAPGGYPDGGPGWAIRDEINRYRYHRGVLGMALSGPDTGGSQWFITHSPQPHLDGTYTVFGRVVDGMDTADAVLQGEFIPAIRVVR
jgi:cyclophilin family peptidyl-prolyl cis-trans isomerase